MEEVRRLQLGLALTGQYGQWGIAEIVQPVSAGCGERLERELQQTRTIIAGSAACGWRWSTACSSSWKGGDTQLGQDRIWCWSHMLRGHNLSPLLSSPDLSC